MIEKQHLEKGFFPHQRWLVGEKFRRGWMIVLFLLTLLPLSQTAKADQDYTAPAAYGWTSFKYPETMHIGFELVFFNYHEGNCGYVGPVNLYVDGELAIDLRKVWDSISDQLGSEKNVRHYIANMLNDPLSFSTTKKGGTVTISNLREGNNKWYACHVDIILDRILDDNDIVLKVSGTWKWTQASDTDKSSGQATRVLTRTIKAPTVTNLPTFTVSRPSKGMAKLSSSLTKHTYPNAITKGKAGTWGYKFHFAKKINKTDFWPLTSDRYTIIQAAKNSGTLQNRNATDYDAGTDATSVAVTMNVPSLYAPTTIYPLVTRFASEYTIFPYNNNGDKAATKGISLNKYTSVVVYGYPRPNPVGKGNASSGEKYAMKATHDQWSKTVTLTWYPQFADANNVNTNGKWIVFRKREGTSDDHKKIGEVAYSKYGKYQNTFIDNDKDLLYDTEYRYTVVFQPNEWNQALTSPSDAPELSSYVLKTITRTSPLHSLNPSTNFKDKVEITCNLNTFYNAGTDANKGQKEYTLNLYRCTPSTSWGPEPIATYTINDSTTTTVVFTDTDVSPCETYKYKVEVTALEKTFSLISSTTGSISGSTEVTSVVASRGTFSGTVRLTWNVTQVGTSITYFNVQRRLLGSQDENDFLTIYTTSGVATSYSYEDNTAQPGTYYEYRVQCYRECNNDGKTEYSDGGSQKTDGFALATGIISGRVSFGTGTAVDSVKVSLEANSSDGETLNPFHSLRIEGTKSYVYLDKTAQKDTTEYFSVFSNSWTAQLYYRSDSIRNSRNTFFDAGVVGLCASDGEISYLAKDYFLNTRGVVEMWDRWYSSGIKIKKGKFYNISFSYNNASPDSMFILRVIDEDGNMQKKVYNDEALATYYNRNIGSTKTWTRRNICFGNTGNGLNTYCVANIDECRIWRKVLTDAELMRNYNRVLSGSEDGLWVYYKFDEGIEKPSIAYDYSKTGGVSNGNHATVVSMDDSDIVPNKDQLSACGLTDSNGNYTISGIPFSGDGTTYSIIPSKGVHSFSPSKSSRFVSGSSLVYSGVDFTDESSFKASGIVRYSGTTIPVEGCTVYVDGQAASMNGNLVQTDEKGEFLVSVPIGNHYIEVKKDGHTFVSNGRYPADVNGVGTTILFNEEKRNIAFWDTTLVNYTGRVVGGTVQGEKTLGCKQSKNNVGRATLKLMYTDSGVFNAMKVVNDASIAYSPNTSTVEVVSQTDNILSHAYRGADNLSQYVFITTDSLTGEFSALLPPLRYELQEIKFVNNNKDNPNAGKNLLKNNVDVDLSDPLTLVTDTTVMENGDIYTYDYHTAYKLAWRTDAFFEVTQQDCIADEFGIDSCVVSDELGDFPVEVRKRIIGSSNQNSVVYNYGYPLFVSQDKYTFNIKAYEQYVNYDMRSTENNEYPMDVVPLSGLPVTISNALSSDQTVYMQGNSENGTPGEVHELKTNSIELDSLGQFSYTWMAGLPNITSPFVRGIQFYYNIDGEMKEWRDGGLKAVILGSLPTGSNFVTQGPDLIDMVLRDPPGSYSSASWTKGTVSSHFSSYAKVWSSEDRAAVTKKNGLIVEFQIGSIGFTTSHATEAENDEEIGVTFTSTGENANSWTRTVSVERSISTSADPEYVGANGDIFIGSSTNIVFGKANEVGLFRNTGGETAAKLDVKEVTTTGLSYGTEFQHSLSHIENYLLPNLEMLRNKFLVTVPNTDEYVNDKDHVVYVTSLDPDDPRFGSDNDDSDVWGDAATERPSSVGKSYRMVLPVSVPKDFVAVDSVMYFNSSIKNWLKHLENNEKQKVTAYEKQKEYLVNNLSFDGGSSVTMTQTTDTTKTSSHDETDMGLFNLNLSTGVTVDGFGFSASFSTITGGGSHEMSESSTTESTSFSYTLEDNPGDALSVDVFDYRDGWSPIFRTRGGQTSAPYEGEVRTSYYMPDEKIIMEGTMQIEKPQLTVDSLKWSMVSNVPTGGAASYTLSLYNNSETKDDMYYRLLVNDETNTTGAKLTIDGLPLTGEGRVIRIPATETVTKTLLLEQTNQSILQYDSISITLCSLVQYDPASDWAPIADTIYVSAQFVPSSSSVHLALDKDVMNTITNDTLCITFDQFDRNYANLKCFRIQSFAPGSTDWTNLQEYVLDPNKLTNGKLLLPKEASVDYIYNMHGKSDGLYRFRVLSVSSYGGREITRSSNEISIYKDMLKPKPLGVPQPSNGILGVGDDISVTFNEDVVSGALTSDDNFEITAVMNGSQIEHNTALSLQGEERTASTEASISLAGRSFSTDMWLYAESDGTILSHGSGTEKFTLSVDKNQHLVINVGKDTYVSEGVMPKDTWCYLTVSYEAADGMGILNATVSESANTNRLFRDCQTAAYNGVGALSIGERMKGAIHELTLWDVAHDNAKAQLERQKTKSPSTANLMGYWKMNEGEGNKITDYARNRHLVSTGETWYINNENKAVVLDGSSYLNFSIGDLAVDAEDNQAVEFWIKADKQQGEAQLLDMGKNGLWMDADGLLKFTSDDNTYDAGTSVLADNEWHHIAINVLRSGNTSVYVDGQRALSTSSRNIATFNDDVLAIGARCELDSTHSHIVSSDRHLTGLVDEVRLWNATLDASSLSNNRKLRLTGKETGLVAYFPFEIKTLDQAEQVVTDTTSLSIVADGVKRVAMYGKNSLAYTDQAPALMAKPTLTNVAFSYTASANKVVININEEPAAIEGCTINFKVKRVKDNNGNSCDPISWTAYVNRNSLAWAEDKVSVTQKGGEETSFGATISNKGGTQQEWYLSGMPSWLKVNTENGYIDPLSSVDLEFTVSKSCPIGKYAETIYLVNGDDLALPLALNVTVTGDVPNWAVDASKYSSSMNLVGTLSVNGVPSTDVDDILGIFVDDECRGVAKPTYSKRYDEYFVMLDVACQSSEKDKDVEFRIYDASTGMVWPVVESTPDVKLTAGAIYGSFNAPVKLNALDKIEQTIALGTGWNWTSLAVNAEDMSVGAVMSGVTGESVLMKSKTASSMTYDGIWEGTLTSLNVRDMYKILMTSAVPLTITGSRPDDTERTISVVPGWNWIAFNSTSIQSVDDAFAGLSPEDGDLVKSKQGFSIYDGYEWNGSLQALTPGQGYMYMSQSSETRTFRYPVSIYLNTRRIAAERSLNGVFVPTDNSQFPGNMTVVARVTYDGQPLANSEIGVFNGDECRTAEFTNDNGIVFLTIPGNGGEELSFIIPYDGVMLKSTATISYEDDGIIGSPNTPYAIDFNEDSIVTSIAGLSDSSSNENWYNVNGIRINAPQKGVNIFRKGSEIRKVVVK